MKVSPDINATFEQLGFKAAFCWQANQMNLYVLADLLTMPPTELINLPGFSYSWLAEVSGFLSQRGCLHWLQTIPGRSVD